MTRDELRRLVKKSHSTTLVANRFRRALGIAEIWAQAARGGHSGSEGKAKAKYVNRRRYKHSRDCMKQKHGVNL